MRGRVILRSRELLCPAKRQCPSRGFPEFLSCFEFSDALQFLVNALDRGDENLFALNCMLRCPGKALGPRFGFSLHFALSMPCKCTFFVVKIPKP